MTEGNVRLLESLATTEPLAEIFSDRSVLASMLQFEVALARVEGAAGVIPAAAADAIGRAADVEVFDPSAIAQRARASGTIAIPFLETLRGCVSQTDPGAAAFLHWGATSQDVADTALVLCLVRASRILAADHNRVAAALRQLSEQHATTVMLGRTLLQPAAPTTLGLKAAGWFGAVSRSGAQLFGAFEAACLLQFGGATGTLAVLGSKGVPIARALASELELPEPDAPWHAHRDRLASLIAACGVYTGAIGKMARDISLLMQHEVAEAAEPGGSSSTMPHKRNPAGCAAALAAATRLPGLVAAFLSGMPQEHERGVGGWHAEWATVSAAVQATGAALAAMADVAESLQVNPGRMRANIAATGGVMFAERAMMLLAPALGRQAASRVIERAINAVQDGRTFAQALAADAEASAALSPDDLAKLDVPEAYLGCAEQFRRRLIGAERD